MARNAEELYLDLLKRTLTYSMWPEPPIPVETSNRSRGLLRSLFVTALSRLLYLRKLRIVRETAPAEREREEGRIWSGCADTMIGRPRLDNLQFCVETAIRDGIEGDLIETGVWRGGACILMRGILAAHGVADRNVYVADSFQGLPRPDPERFPADRDSLWHVHDVLAVSQAEVENNFRRYGLLDQQVVFLKGWFKETLPNAPIEKLAVLRLAGDMYESTMDALGALYPKLSEGGFCIIDDYALPECRQAVTDFRREHGIRSEMIEIDWTGQDWRK